MDGMKRNPTVLAAFAAAAATALAALAADEVFAAADEAIREAEDARASARFEPWIDTRNPGFSRKRIEDYGNIHSGCGYLPGEVVFSLPDGPEAGTWRDGPLEFRVETLPVDKKNVVPPLLPPDAHYDRNPLLPMPSAQPFKQPTGSESAFFAPGSAPSEVRVPLRLQSSVGDVLFARWEIRSRGETVAEGILPEGFIREYANSGNLRSVVDTRALSAAERAGVSGAVAFPAGPGLARAWPLLSNGDFSPILFDSDSIDRIFGTGTAGAEAFSRFATRAALFGIPLRTPSGTADGSAERLAAAETGRKLPVVANFRLRETGGRGNAFFSSAPVGASTYWRKDERPERDAPKHVPARVPDDLLGRRLRPYGLFTALFVAAFCAGTAAILIRFFAFAKGPARMGVWRALPVWCAGSSALALLVPSLVLDRAPRADVTEWRFGAGSGPDELRVAFGRAQSFEAGPASWTVPADAWFFKRTWHGELDDSAEIRLDSTSGVRRLLDTATGGERGRVANIYAARFAPRQSVVSLSPDPAARAEDFQWVLGPAPDGENAPAPSDSDREAFARLLRGWTSPDSRDAAPVPQRSVTAGADFSGVWVWARGRWHALGPMKAGETRALDASQIVRYRMDTRGTHFTSVFADAPFAVDAGWIEDAADAWLARDRRARNPDGNEAAPADPFPEDGRAGASSGSDGRNRNGKGTGPVPTAAFLEALDDAFVVAIRAPAQSETPFLSAAFPSSRPPKTTGRTVHVEAFR